MDVRVTILPVLHRLRDVAFVSSFVCFLSHVWHVLPFWWWHETSHLMNMTSLKIPECRSWCLSFLCRETVFARSCWRVVFFAAVDAAIIATLQSLASICRKIRGSGQPVQAIKLFQGLEKLVSTSIFDTGLSYFMAWSLQSYPTAVFNERIWYFRGSKHTLTLLHIFSGIRTPYPHDPRPWLR